MRRFDEDTLGLDWQFVRNPDHSGWSLTERPGYLRLWTGDWDLHDIRAKIRSSEGKAPPIQRRRETRLFTFGVRRASGDRLLLQHE
ncbi:hypothetical protein PO124_17155 [Bacillus licheniformis]|nr:hypothetical protein [Bacillus licheniformis]